MAIRHAGGRVMYVRELDTLISLHAVMVNLLSITLVKVSKLMDKL